VRFEFDPEKSTANKSAFITYRHETIRIISVRRARPEEEARYLVV